MVRTKLRPAALALCAAASAFVLWSAVSGFGQAAASDESRELSFLKRQFEELSHRLDQVEKSVDDILWFDRVGDVAFVDKVRIVGQGYVVVAPEYRGSTGYGAGIYRLVDYGGLENEDVYAARNFVVENYGFVDKDRVGIVGWSHGGLIALMNAFNHPESYQACFAGNPVSDLVARMGYKDQSYRDEFEAPYSIGQSAEANVREYRRRSPVTHVDKLRIPLLVHTNTNDEDVNVLEVEHLIQALKAAGKKFEYEIFQDAPGGHSMDRLDIRNAKTIRLKIYDFLARYLKPPRPFKSLEDLQRAGYL